MVYFFFEKSMIKSRARISEDTISIINKHCEKKLEINPISGLNLSRTVKVMSTIERMKQMFERMNFVISIGECFFIFRFLLL